MILFQRYKLWHSIQTVSLYANRQCLFSWENKKNISECPLLNFLPSTLNVIQNIGTNLQTVSRVIAFHLPYRQILFLISNTYLYMCIMFARNKILFKLTVTAFHFDKSWLLYLPQVFRQTGLSKQYTKIRPENVASNQGLSLIQQ